MNMKIKIDEIKIKIKITDGKQKAIVSLDFGDFVIKGFRVQESKFDNNYGDRLWVTPPTYPTAFKYHPIVYFPDKELWKELEVRIRDAFRREERGYQAKKYGVKEEEL